MKALVVGGTGFVGMNVVRALVRGGHDVSATRRPHGNTLFARRLGAELVHVDLDDTDSLARAMCGREVVFMCAGHYPRYSLDREAEVRVARARVRRTLDAARRAGVRRYVLTSSVATVGPPPSGRLLSDERDPVERRSLRCVYHAVKAAIEDEAMAAHRAGLDVVTLCPTAIFGELDVKAGTGFLVVALGNGVMPFYVEGRTNVVDADDLAHAHVLAAERGKGGQRYVVGGHNIRAGALIEGVAETLGVPASSQRLPAGLAATIATLSEMRAHTLKDGQRPLMSRELVDVVRFGRWVSTEKAQRELGLPPPTSLATTLDKACRWYARHRYVKNANLCAIPGECHDPVHTRDPDRRRDHHPAHTS